MQLDPPHTPAEFRRCVRNGGFHGPTAGLCGAYAQANLVILPETDAAAFLRFCQLNPKPCPLLAVGEPGEFRLDTLGVDLDVRTDAPGYYLYRDGVRAGELTSLTEVWRDDFVVFAIGCSFSFEQVLLDHGVPLRHVAQRKNVAMYRTAVPNRRAGCFGGSLVVSMRPLSPAYVIRAVQLTSRYPAMHGTPVHFGDPAALGIADLDRPDWGDPIEIAPGELPVFWACGVTPHDALMSARLPFAITHKPGHMLVTDVTNASLAVF